MADRDCLTDLSIIKGNIARLVNGARSDIHNVVAGLKDDTIETKAAIELLTRAMRDLSLISQ